MHQVYIDLKKYACISVVLSILFYTVICLGFSIPPELMLLKLGIILTLVGCYWGFFEKWGWKCNMFRIWGWLCDIPDLNGRWEGTLDRLTEDNPHQFVIEIQQTLSKIQIHSYSKNSLGHSIVAQFVTDQVGGKYNLITTWTCRTRNTTNSNEFEEFHGTSIYEIVHSDDGLILEDYYFTRRNPQTKGQTRLKLSSKKLKYSF